VFQFYNLIPSLTAHENITLITEITPNPINPKKTLHLVSLDPHMDHFPTQLSNNEQQQITITRTITKRPTILLCDEPTKTLDIHTNITMIKTVKRINRKLGTLTVIITHNTMITNITNRMLTLSDDHITSKHHNTTHATINNLS
jgi:ABC-type antimicrobial peptide transport system, ATPase component